MADCTRLADALDVAGALEMEAFVANPSILNAVLRERPYAGLQTTAARLRAAARRQPAVAAGACRATCRIRSRSLPAANPRRAARRADYARGQLDIELNAAQSNPLVDVEEERVVSVGCFDVLPLAAALDFLSIALAPVLTSANERVMKLLHAGFSDSPPASPHARISATTASREFGVAGQAIAAEARLLAAPVSFEMASSTQAEGIEDRTTMAPLAARRLAEMVSLGERLVAIELVVAARAIDFRAGAGTSASVPRPHTD